ncbi:MAG: beta-phosphoglucomutase [Cyanobacteria bacterium CRU_2_1]|nr:beta-phosphoglucomutase [Cyanobacteria bacterium CRU_2_1]
MNTTIASNSHLIYQDWILTETQFNPDQLNYKETVFTIGNGYLSSRGSFEEGHPSEIPATFINGVYDDIPLFYTELVNCPDWLSLRITIDGEEFCLNQGDVLSYQRQLDLRRGFLSRNVRWRSPSGKTIDLFFEQFASLSNLHLLALRCQLTPVDFDGRIQIQVGLNSYAENQGFGHWIRLNQGQSDTNLWLQVRTKSSQIQLGMAAKVTLSGAKGTTEDDSVPGYPAVKLIFQAFAGQTVSLEKLVSVFTSREADEPAQAARTQLSSVSGYDDLLKQQEQAWNAVWQRSDILIEGDSKAQLIVRYNLFQLLISAPWNDDRVSIPAKTLSGLGYRGHIFWDTEFFILPFFIHTQPEVARNLLTYRYHTLEGARRKAAHYGYRGAMYAWESADTGDEVTPRWGTPDDPYGEDIRIWCRDREVHISSDIAAAVWWYWYATQDHEWMRDYGAEIVLDTALFWSSRVEYNVKRECWEIRGVIGPDEYHENVDNNAFTNRLVQWHLQIALNVYDWLSITYPEKAAQLEKQLQITPQRRQRWQDIVANLWIPYDSNTGLVEQFEGFFQLEDINLDDYEPRTRSMQAILGIKGASQRQVLKQPDVLMLLFVMGKLAATDYGVDVLKKNWHYYARRTDVSYGSSLGPAIQGLVAASVGEVELATQYLKLAALVDLEDTRGNAADGIHAASCGSIWMAIILGIAGIQITEDEPVARPHLPPHWQRLKFKLYWRGVWKEFDLKPETEPLVPEIQGFIFDLDGVLTDTAEFHYQAWQRLADEEGFPFDRQANETLRGLSRRESLMRIVGNRPYSEDQILEMMEHKNRYYVESIKTISQKDLLPGVIDFLDELRSAGIKIAIGSASKNARPVIEQLGIADRINAIADGYSVQQSKPAPDLFLYAASQLGLKPSQCVVVEDAASGVQAALTGGMRAVGLGSTQRVGAAHVVLPSLEEVHWSDLQVKLAQASKGTLKDFSSKRG